MTEATSPIVFIVDDDKSVRESLRLLVEAEDWRSETFESGQDFLARDSNVSAPHCLILDVVLPDLDGCDVQTLLVDRTAMPIIFITGHGDVQTSVRAMKGGAVEFLTKPFPDDAIVSSIRHALGRSEEALSEASALQVLRDRYSLLSAREREVMTLVVWGKLNKQVGFELGINEATVKAHRGQLMRKMQADSVCDLVRMAAKLGVDELPSANAPHTGLFRVATRRRTLADLGYYLPRDSTAMRKTI